jgi:plasmid maintenance system antidote protein VapI
MGSTKKKKMTLSCGAYIRSLFYYLYRKEDYKNVFETMEFTEEEIKNVIKGRNAVTLEGFITSDAFKLLTCDRL